MPWTTGLCLSDKYRKGPRELVTLYRDKDKPCRPPRGRRLKTIRGEHVPTVVRTVNVGVYLEDPPVSAPTALPLAEAVSVSGPDGGGIAKQFLEQVAQLLFENGGEDAPPKILRVTIETEPESIPTATLKAVLREILDQIRLRLED